MSEVTEKLTVRRPCEHGHQHVFDLTADELLAAFAETMREWGHAGTAAGLRYPTLEEARAVCAGRPHGKTDRPAA